MLETEKMLVSSTFSLTQNNPFLQGHFNSLPNEKNFRQVQSESICRQQNK